MLIQVNADIFIMDWEKPKQQFMADGRSSKSGPPGTIAWRSILIANEVNELTVEMRKIKPETTLIWFAFFWIGIGWQYISQTNPDFQKIPIEQEPQNDFLKFFLVAFIFICIAIGQLILYWFVAGTTGSDSVSFTNLCSVANISILFLEYRNYGYYIHG